MLGELRVQHHYTCIATLIYSLEDEYLANARSLVYSLLFTELPKRIWRRCRIRSWLYGIMIM